MQTAAKVTKNGGRHFQGERESWFLDFSLFDIELAITVDKYNGCLHP